MQYFIDLLLVIQRSGQPRKVLTWEMTSSHLWSSGSWCTQTRSTSIPVSSHLQVIYTWELWTGLTICISSYKIPNNSNQIFIVDPSMHQVIIQLIRRSVIELKIMVEPPTWKWTFRFQRQHAVIVLVHKYVKLSTCIQISIYNIRSEPIVKNWMVFLQRIWYINIVAIILKINNGNVSNKTTSNSIVELTPKLGPLVQLFLVSTSHNYKQ